MVLSPLLRRSRFEDLDGWATDTLIGAWPAFLRSARDAASASYRTGALGIEAAALARTLDEAVEGSPTSEADARFFFERHFVPYIVHSPDEPGFVTGFYEPVAEASPVRTERFGVPLLGPPDDLLKIDDANRPSGLDPYLAFARKAAGGIVEYFDRAAIEKGAIDGCAPALAWLADPVDAFFIHVQGAARLRFPDGAELRITYAAKSGQRFIGPGHVLAELGEIPRELVTMQSIRAWFRANPHRIDEILHRNRSYIFFRVAPAGEPDLGPVAAAKVQLTPGRSLAVDRLLHTFGTPVFVQAPGVTVVDGSPFARLMIAQDTGSAIVGPARGDLFTGSGDEAGEIAGVIRSPATFHVLVPRELAEA